MQVHESSSRGWRVALGLVAATAALATAPSTSHAAPVQCDVAIVGGGPGGVHTAYKLTQLGLTSGAVCLFEKRDHLGGRVGNNEQVGWSGAPYVNNGVTVAGSGQTGTGGYRMYQNQYTYKLGLELAALGAPGQLTFQSQRSFSRLSGITNQGYNPSFPLARYFTYNNGGVAKFFQKLYFSPINDNDLFKTLLCGPQVPTVNGFPQYRQMNIPGLSSMSTMEYLQWVTANVVAPQHGPEVAQYFLDVYRFRGDFDTANDAVSYLEYNAKDYTGGLVWYPLPSFQPYFDIMAAQTTARGGRIYLDEKILSANTQATGPRYVLTTSKGNTVTANSIVFATTHNALDPANGGIAGSLTSAIAAAPEFQYVQTTNAITVTHQYGSGAAPYTGWWRGDIRYPTSPQLLGPQLGNNANPLRRTTNNFLLAGELLPGCAAAWCDFRGRMFFTNTNELPLTDYHDFINVSRDIYNDQRDAVNNWVDLYSAGEALAPGGGGNEAVNRQIRKSFRLMYPTVFTGNPATEPQMLKTQVTVHIPAWYNLKEGALAQGITNDSLFQWSLRPLAGERVYLVGDAWRPDLSGWSDGAYKGSVYILNRYFGAAIDPKEESTIKCIGGDIVDPD